MVAAVCDSPQYGPSVGAALDGRPHVKAGGQYGGFSGPDGGGRAQWRRRFGGDPGVVGQSILLDDQSYRIAGVMPADFQFPAADPTDYIASWAQRSQYMVTDTHTKVNDVRRAVRGRCRSH